MITLDKKILNFLVDLLSPYLSAHGDRQALLLLAIGDVPLLHKIDWQGSTEAFIVNTCTLLAHNKIENKSALVIFLEYIKQNYLGIDYQEEVVRLIELATINKELDVVICHESEDAQEFAETLALSLVESGYRTWIDSFQQKGGVDWIENVERAILSCKVFLVVRSPLASTSIWVKRERLIALNANKHIIAVMDQECSEDLELLDKECVNFQKDYQQAIKILKKLLETIVGDKVTSSFDQRILEKAYLGRVLLEHAIWKDLYISMAGVATITEHVERKNQTTKMVMHPSVIQPLFRKHINEKFSKVGQSVDIDDSIRDYGDILDAVKDFRQLLILGEPGSGKTTTTWKLVADFAEKARNSAIQPIPILINVKEIGGSESLMGMILNKLGDLGAYFEFLNDQGRIALLVDGLNEIPIIKREQYLSGIRALAESALEKDLIFIITCRELDYSNELEIGISDKLRITPLDPLRIMNFIRSYIREPYRNNDVLFWQLAGAKAKIRWSQFQENIGNHPDIFWLSIKLPEGKVWWYWNSWLTERKSPRNLINLASNPYILYLITQVFTDKENIPENRALLFDLFIEFLLLEREKISLLLYNELINKLSEIAYLMQEQDITGSTIPREKALGILETEKNLYYCISANLLNSYGYEISFSHQLLQEFFAARYLDRKIRNGVLSIDYFPENEWWKPTGWEETIVLLAGFYADDMEPFINWLKDSNPLLTARCINEINGHIPEAKLRELRVLWWNNIKSSPSPVERATIGKALGLIKDDRPGVGIKDDNPDIFWIRIPDGKFIFQGNISLQIPEFYIAKYPITYSQYRIFVDDNGYSNDLFWSKDGIDWRQDQQQPRYYWNDTLWNIYNYPVVGISWFEAEAYCKWLSARMKLNISLPKEIEWEKAARGNDGRAYPYGIDFNPKICNVRETGIGNTSAVGIFPEGASPYGVMDTSGNVWEWCEKETNSQLVSNPKGNLQILRGGSWGYNRILTRTVTRRTMPPSASNGYFGFRICKTAFSD